MLAVALGVLVILVALQDAFEAMVLPRRVARRWRLARFFYRLGWGFWRCACQLLPPGRNRENALGVFGPLSLLGLFATWVVLLISGFALVHWGGELLPLGPNAAFSDCMYHSGETFFTLGYGDITPAGALGRFVAVLESGIGFGFMALVIGYLPVLYQAFSRREQNIALLDARAGSPPTAGELLRRYERFENCAETERFLAEWELWSAHLLESHLSFPVLSYYRSQHDNQSWIAALATILDASATCLISGSDVCRRRAELTFAMARHACVDMCLVFWLPPVEPLGERLTAAETERLFSEQGVDRVSHGDLSTRLAEIRSLYEPFLQSLATYFCFFLPRFFPERTAPDNWQTTPWARRAPGITELPAGSIRADEHFG